MCLVFFLVESCKIDSEDLLSRAKQKYIQECKSEGENNPTNNVCEANRPTYEKKHSHTE